VLTRSGNLILTSPRDIIFRRGEEPEVAFSLYASRLDDVEEVRKTRTRGLEASEPEQVGEAV
jgi:hypothetical protein